MKKLSRVFLLTLLASLCLTAFAGAEEISGQCGDNMVNILDMSVFRTNFGKTAAKDCTYVYGA